MNHLQMRNCCCDSTLVYAGTSAAVTIKEMFDEEVERAVFVTRVNSV
jgi:hypothetical protein